MYGMSVVNVVQCPSCGSTATKVISLPDRRGEAKMGCTVCKKQFKYKVQKPSGKR